MVNTAAIAHKEETVCMAHEEEQNCYYEKRQVLEIEVVDVAIIDSHFVWV